MVLTEILGICRGFRADGRIRKLVRVAELVRRGGRHDAVSRIRGHRRSCKGKLVMPHVARPRCSVGRCRPSYVMIDEGRHAGDVEALFGGILRIAFEISIETIFNSPPCQIRRGFELRTGCG